MRIDVPLYESNHICLAPIDYDKDPEIESEWTHDSGYLRLLDSAPALPLSTDQIKKKYEQIEKKQEEGRSLIYFTIRMREADRLIGFVKLYWIEWASGTALLKIGIGKPEDRNQGYGSEVLDLILRYAFDELNLFRLTVFVPEYHEAALHFFKKVGFVEEVRRRQALRRDGKRWDMIHLGILRDDWQK